MSSVTLVLVIEVSPVAYVVTDEITLPEET